MRGLFYPWPTLELMFSRRVKDKPVFVGDTIGPYDTCTIYVAWLRWGKRFNIKYR